MLLLDDTFRRAPAQAVADGLAEYVARTAENSHRRYSTAPHLAEFGEEVLCAGADGVNTVSLFGIGTCF
jgi:hypothetical protein